MINPERHRLCRRIRGPPARGPPGPARLPLVAAPAHLL